MVFPTDFANFQQQLRQEVMDMKEVNATISDRMNMLNSINTVTRTYLIDHHQIVSDQQSHSEKLGR